MLAGARSRWETLSADGIGRPDGVRWRPYLRFLRQALTCVALGHREGRLLHRFERAGRHRGRMLMRDACSRCGQSLSEHRSKPLQFPQPRGGDQGRFRA